MEDKVLNINNVKIYNEDCLGKNGLCNIKDKSINLILCDLPYSTTPLAWDILLPMGDYVEIKKARSKKYKLMEKTDYIEYSMLKLKKSYEESLKYFEENKKIGLWGHYSRIIKDNGAIILTSQQPFTTYLINSNLGLYKYNWIWEKDNATNFLNSKYQPKKITEDICVFGKSATSYNKKGRNMVYNPQMLEGKPYVSKSGNKARGDGSSAVIRAGSDLSNHITVNTGTRYPNNIIKFNRDKDKLHPTQKPVKLFEYLIETYTNKGDTVLDNCLGSGTTAVASINTGRKCIGYEKEIEYFNLIKDRLSKL